MTESVFILLAHFSDGLVECRSVALQPWNDFSVAFSPPAIDNLMTF